MTIREKLKQSTPTDGNSIKLSYCGIDWKIYPEDDFKIYYDESTLYFHSCMKDIDKVPQQYLDMEFDAFRIEKPHQFLNHFNVCFILHKDLSPESGIDTKIKYVD